MASFVQKGLATLIIASKFKEVLTDDGFLTAKDWEVWFVMDL